MGMGLLLACVGTCSAGLRAPNVSDLLIRGVGCWDPAAGCQPSFAMVPVGPTSVGRLSSSIYSNTVKSSLALPNIQHSTVQQSRAQGSRKQANTRHTAQEAGACPAGLHAGRLQREGSVCWKLLPLRRAQHLRGQRRLNKRHPARCYGCETGQLVLPSVSAHQQEQCSSRLTAAHIDLKCTLSTKLELRVLVTLEVAAVSGSARPHG